MYYFFGDWSKFEKIDVTQINTENVKNMKGMFFNCKELTSLYITKFKTNNVLDTSSMLNIAQI